MQPRSNKYRSSPMESEEELISGSGDFDYDYEDIWLEPLEMIKKQRGQTS